MHEYKPERLELNKSRSELAFIIGGKTHESTNERKLKRDESCKKTKFGKENEKDESRCKWKSPSGTPKFAKNNPNMHSQFSLRQP